VPLKDVEEEVEVVGTGGEDHHGELHRVRRVRVRARAICRQITVPLLFLLSSTSSGYYS